MSFFAIGYLASTNLAMLMEEDTKHQAEKYAENVSSLFMEGYAFTYTNAVHQEYLKETGQTDREALKRFLANYLERHEKFYAIWTQFEPNAWDGRDAEFAGKPGYSDIGLNSPWVYRNDGKVIIGAEGSYAETEEYYAVPKSIKKPYVTTPYHDETTADTLTMMSTITIPLFDSDGTFIGVTGTDIALSTFQDLISGLKFFESGYGTIISSDGTIVAHPKIELVGKNVKELDTEEANALLFATIEQGLINSTTTFSTATQEKVLRLFAPIEIAGTGQRWVFSSSIPLREVNAVSNKILRYIIIFSLAFLFAVSLIILVLASRIVKPVKALADGMKILSTGDFTKKMDVQSRDEIGMIGKGFNEFVDKLSSMLKDTKEANQRLSEVGKLLSEDMNQVSSAVTQIASASKNSKEVIERQVESVTSVSGVMEGISKQVEALGRLIEIQSANITESSASIEEMIANIRSVTSNAGTAASMTRELVKASQIGKEKMDAVTAQVKRISERSQGLIDTNTIIANIASQTNMLAMNAAIEAAHAGNAGKGFSVVADEVRKLAEISTKQSKGIKEHLKEITAIIESVAASAENTALSFEDISRLVTDVDNIQGTIKHAMSEQSEGSKQILSSLAEMNRATTDVSEGATEMKDGTAKIYVEIENLVDLSSEVNQGIAEIASGASHIESSVTHVKELSEKNKALIADVLEKTEQFHVS